LDSTVIETYGLQKQGGKHFTYLNTRGYHPLLAVLAETGEVVHSRLREGKASAGRGAASFARQALVWLGRLGPHQEVVVRADPGFYSEKVVAACRPRSLLLDLGPAAEEPPRADRRHPRGGLEAHPLLAGRRRRRGRDPLPALRQEADLPADRAPGEPPPGTQLWLRGLDYSYYAFLTDREGEMLELEADHRQHAVVESAIRDLKYRLALHHMPSGKFGANAAWLALNVIAHNLCRWLGRLGDYAVTCLTAWRHRFFALLGRLVEHGQQRRLGLPVGWPWGTQFLALLKKVLAVAVPLAT
jgi:Transposase DDE domain group 1